MGLAQASLCGLVRRIVSRGGVLEPADPGTRPHGSTPPEVRLRGGEQDSQAGNLSGGESEGQFVVLALVGCFYCCSEGIDINQNKQ